MSDEPIPSLAEALTEIRRLRAETDRLHCEGITAAGMTRFWEVISEGKDAEIERLRQRIAELEGAAAITFGTLEKATTLGPVVITHNVPPSAPPHDE